MDDSFLLLKGSAPANSKVKIGFQENGMSVSYIVEVDEGGSFFVAHPEVKLSEGMTLTVTASSNGKLESSPVTVKVVKANGTTSGPDVRYVSDERTGRLEGKLEGEGIILVSSEGNSLPFIYWTSADGSFSFPAFYMPIGARIKVVGKVHGKAASSPVEVIVTP